VGEHAAEAQAFGVAGELGGATQRDDLGPESSTIVLASSDPDSTMISRIR
jgi:hypothetical protein